MGNNRERGRWTQFVLSPAVIRKLGFIHELVHDGRATEAPSTSLADALLGSLLPWKRKAGPRGISSDS